jgi:transposase
VHLARLPRLDEYTAVSVSVPTPDQEAARDLVRAREDARCDLMRARHRRSKLLLRQGIVYSGGRPWTDAHEAWLWRQRFDSAALQTTYESDFDAVLTVRARRDRLDQQIAVMAAASEFTPLLRRLGCLRGVGDLTGLALAVEIGDWHRFAGSTIGSFVGLVPASTPPASHACRARSPMPATPTSAGCWAPPGATAPATWPARPCATGGRSYRGRSGTR